MYIEAQCAAVCVTVCTRARVLQCVLQCAAVCVTVCTRARCLPTAPVGTFEKNFRILEHQTIVISHSKFERADPQPLAAVRRQHENSKVFLESQNSKVFLESQPYSHFTQ